MDNKVGQITFNPQSMPTISKLAGLKMKTTEKTKIELDLKDAFRLADTIEELKDFTDYGFSDESLQRVNVLIKKLRNAEPEKF